jgi:teichuronic acid biosynthesis glycosyltransferase TuaH
MTATVSESASRLRRTHADHQVTDQLVVVIAGTSWDGIWQSERHIAMQLARRVPVLWVDPPISYLTPLRDRVAVKAVREPRLRRVAPNVLRLSPITVPGVTRPVLREIAIRQARSAVRRTVAAIGARAHSTIVASVSDMLDVLPDSQSVFYGTDDFAAGARLTGTDAHWLQAGTQRQLSRADVVVVTSPALKEKWSKFRPDIKVIANGCDADRFATVDQAKRPSDVHLPPPIAGFVGHLSERIDLSMLEAVAAAEISLLLVGPPQPSFEISKLGPLLELPNVQWVGAKAFEELPSYLQVIDVGLTPYVQSDFNSASFPLKTLEYLAAGRPAVVSDLPAHRWLGTSEVTIAATPEQFAEQTRALLHAPRRPEDVRARQAFAAQHSWEARAAEISELLGLDTALATQSR